MYFKTDHLFLSLLYRCSLLVWLMYNKMLMLLLLFGLFFPGIRFFSSSNPSNQFHHADRSIIIVIIVVVLYICCIVVKKFYDDIFENNNVQHRSTLEFGSTPNVLETFHSRRQGRRQQNSSRMARRSENSQHYVLHGLCDTRWTAYYGL